MIARADEKRDEPVSPAMVVRRIEAQIAEISRELSGIDARRLQLLAKLEALTALVAPPAGSGAKRETRAVAQRREALATILRARGPCGPTELAALINEGGLADGELASRSKVADVLRRYPETFSNIGRGKWALADAGAEHGSDDVCQMEAAHA